MYQPDHLHDQHTHRLGADWCIIIDLPQPIPPAIAQLHYIPAVHNTFVISELDLLSRCGPSDDPWEQAVLNQRVRTLLLLLVQEQARATQPLSQSEQLADQARQWIRDHCHEVVGIQAIAAAFNIGADYLRHSFSKRHEQTVISCWPFAAWPEPKTC